MNDDIITIPDFLRSESMAKGKHPIKMLESSAVFSPCREYRYELWRRWGVGERYAMFIGLNPSTADETLDDPTIRRCIRFSRGWGFDAFLMTNIFAFRATDPNVMKARAEPIGPRNDTTIALRAKSAGIIVAAWGVHGEHLDRGVQVQGIVNTTVRRNLHCLGTTQAGHPRHPLYIASATKPVIYGSQIG